MTQTWYSTKTYTHNEGLSCAFRQWRANSHCNLIHGYALKFHFVFKTHELDERNWCADYGDFKELKTWLHHMFDHTTCVAQDDPHLSTFHDLDKVQIIDIRVVPSVGCEKFAEMAFTKAAEIVASKYGNRVSVVSVQVFEHEGNSAMYSENDNG